MAEIHIGTSGWHYDDWNGRFYPESLADGDKLRYYAKHYSTVEVNNTFYQLPEQETLERWRDSVPNAFLFAVKASRYLTHMKKLKGASEPLHNFLQRVATLGDRLGPILFQLPPNWHADIGRLQSFLDLLPSGYRYAFEFRDPTWFDEEVYALLRTHDIAFCVHDMAPDPAPHIVTANFVYVRFHGTHGKYEGGYTKQQLSGWAGAFSSWRRAGHDVYGYFNNDFQARAVQNAADLAEMLDG